MGKRILNYADDLAKEMEDHGVSVNHFYIAGIKFPNDHDKFLEVFDTLGYIDKKRVIQILQKRLGSKTPESFKARAGELKEKDDFPGIKIIVTDDDVNDFMEKHNDRTNR